MESTPSSAVPFSVIAHDGRFGTDAVAFAFHVTLEPDSVPFAVPETFRSPVQVALNVPLAVLPVCCVTFHLKSVHALAVGMTFADVQLPRSPAMPVADGPVVLFRSYPRQADVATMQSATSVVLMCETSTQSIRPRDSQIEVEKAARTVAG
jgi:hypothetical protein